MPARLGMFLSDNVQYSIHRPQRPSSNLENQSFLILTEGRIIILDTSGLKIGIETEMLLSLRETPKNGMPDIDKYAKDFAIYYNEATAVYDYPRMHADIDAANNGKGVNIEWSVTDDQSILSDASGDTACKLYQRSLYYKSPSTPTTAFKYPPPPPIAAACATRACGSSKFAG